MPKAVYGGVSADGYIVGPDGKSDWSMPDEELHRFHNEQARARRPAVGASLVRDDGLGAEPNPRVRERDGSACGPSPNQVARSNVPLQRGLSARHAT